MNHLAAVPDHRRYQPAQEDDLSQAPIALIRAEHEGILECFHEIGKGAANDESYVNLVQQLCDRLTVYLSIKEDIVIPALRRICFNSAMREQIDESIVEHFSIKILLETLDGEGPDDELFKAKLTVLQRHFIRHIGFEQRFLFPRLISFTPIELEGRILEHRARLIRDLDRADR